jgi:hypothetical protein
MAEKKTFKNIPISNEIRRDLHEDELIWQVYTADNAPTREKFNSSEWDMEVTFTKKVEPIEVGNQVVHINANAAKGIWTWLGNPTMTVLQVIENKAWCRTNGTGQDVVFKLIELKHAS